MKTVLLILLFVAAASARAGIQPSYLMPPMKEFFMRAVDGPRIVGGNDAEPHSRPFQVGLLLTFGEMVGFCGGSLLNNQWVLTAAHCIWNGRDTATEAEVVLGAHDIFDVEGTTRFITEDFIMHPEWNPAVLQNDIALIKLPGTVSPTDKIQFVNLPPRSAVEETFVDYEGTPSGWGKSSDASQTIADILQVVKVNVITNSACNTRFPGVIKPMHVCTSGSGGKNVCAGDSGGPLTVEYEGKTVQIGIVSFGLSFGCERGWPSAYARTTTYLDWISEVTK